MILLAVKESLPMAAAHVEALTSVGNITSIKTLLSNNFVKQ